MSQRGALKDGEVRIGTGVEAPGAKSDVRRLAKYLGVLSSLDGTDHVPGHADALATAADAVGALQATDVAGGMLSANVSSQVPLVLWNRARRALYALAPVAAYRLAQHMDSAVAPGNLRAIIEVAKGTGMLAQSEPISDGERDKQITRKDLADLSNEELNRRLQEAE